jgi:DNA-binding beta-propeller fold protein YncE
MNKNTICGLFLVTLLFSLFFVSVIVTAPASATASSAKSTSSSTRSSSSTPIFDKGSNNNASLSGNRVSTSGGTLDVLLLTLTKGPITTHHQTIFQVSFLKKGQPSGIQKHIDYTFAITKTGDTQACVIQGAPNQPVHIAEGVATIPYEFQTTGDFLVNVTVYGILYSPIKPESALFRIKVMSGQEVSNGTTAITSNSINNSTIKKLSTGIYYSRGQQQQYSFAKEWDNVGSYQLKGAAGVATDSVGNVYVVDPTNRTIAKFTSDGKFITKWGSLGNSQFVLPTAIATDSLGNVYVTDFSIKAFSTIQKFTSDGKFITKWGSPGVNNSQFNYTKGIAVDSFGNVYVADSGNHRIQKFDSNGNFITKWGFLGCGWQLKFPAGIAVDHQGRIYVSDLGNNITLKFDSNGNFITKWGSTGAGDGQFNYPTGIAVDSFGNVYVADSGNHRIQKFDSNGNFITKWGSTGAGDGQFKSPDSIALDPTGKNVYVTDSDSHSVKVFTLTSNRTR